MVRQEARDIVAAKATALRAMPSVLEWQGFLEVETPVLQPVHGGANARPFTTHINAYDLDIYLRIALELHLKRLLVGGIEKVFEIGRIFRNEGVDSTHNPEFTMLEAYEAYGDYDTIGKLTRELIQRAAVAAFGTTVLRRADGGEFDIGGEWPGARCTAPCPRRWARKSHPTPARSICGGCARRRGCRPSRAGAGARSCSRCTSGWWSGRCAADASYRDFPVEVSPLTRAHRKDPRLAERWDLVAFGTELGTGYSELIDPVEERARLTEQSLLAAGGDPEAMQLDEDFLRALEYGMPPMGGMGVGIDRLVMLFTGENIRETILFPHLKPQA